MKLVLSTILALFAVEANAINCIGTAPNIFCLGVNAGAGSGGQGNGGGNSNCTASDPLSAACVPTVDQSQVPTWVVATDLSTKVFQTSGVPTWSAPGSSNTLVIAVMRNENGYGQVHIHAPSALSSLDMSLGNLTGSQFGKVIHARTATSAGGFSGCTEFYTLISTPTSTNSSAKDDYYGVYGANIPDACVDQYDPYYSQSTTVLPINVTSGNNQSFAFQVHTGTSTADYPSDFYKGTITFSTGTGGGKYTIAKVPVIVELGDWTMPSTTTLLSYNSPQYGDLFKQQWGSINGGLPYNSNCTDANDCARVLNHDACVFLLDHHWQCGNTNLAGDSVTTMDSKMGHLFDGTVSSTWINPLLPGAKITGSQEGLQSRNQATCSSWMTDFQNNNRNFNVLMPFDYAADEPSGNTQWSQLTSSMTSLSACGIPFLVTTSYSVALTHGATSQINVLLPLVNNLKGHEGDYTAWLASQSSATAGTYSDCVSGDSCAIDTPGTGTGFANPHIDGRPVNNMMTAYSVWHASFTMELNSTISYCMVHNCEGTPGDTWTDGGQQTGQGNGDENWVLPGTTARIGVTTPTYVSTLRLDLSDVSHEKFEYMTMLKNSGHSGTVWTALATFFTDLDNFNEDSYQATGAFTGTVTSANKTLFCAVQQAVHPGATCAF